MYAHIMIFFIPRERGRWNGPRTVILYFFNFAFFDLVQRADTEDCICNLRDANNDYEIALNVF
jgi:hypothetical protein